jgi:hypothetical protein
MLIFFIVTDIFSNNIISSVVAHSGLLIFCFYYYYQLFKNIPTINLLKEPSFWIISGICFGMSAHIPFSTFGYYLYHNLSRQIYLSLAIIGVLSYGIMHLFFIKGFLCIIRKQSRL